MSLRFPVRRVREGASTLMVPELKQADGEPLDHALSRAPVFYNPRMRLNRDSAVLALRVHRRRLSRPIVVCEPMCGTGVRGIRLVLEVDGVERAVLGDLNPVAVGLAEENAALNGVSDRVLIRRMDANLLLSLHGRPRRRFDYIDIDPYGSPVPYLDAAVRACRSGGMIALTATDMAPLCGVNPEACLRRYGGRPLRTAYCHEVAVRLVAGALVAAAARHDVAARPVFSYAVDHYVRVYAVLERGARRADRSLEGMGLLLHCPGCLHRRPAAVGELGGSGRCGFCGSRMMVGGPMWLGGLADAAFCDEMLAALDRAAPGMDPRLGRLVRLVRDEAGLGPAFYNIDALCSRLRIPSPSMGDVLSALGAEGFEAVRTHFDERGVRTDASVVELQNVLKRLWEGQDGAADVP